MDTRVTNAIRCLAIDTVQAGNSGHPGAPMGMAPVSHILFSEFLKFDPSDPHWHDRDRFVLSNGHASALIYTMLHLCGYNVPIDQLRKFRQLGSITPGHPERHVTEGVEVTTGPLGQGLSNAVGLAMAEAHLAATFNQPEHTLVNHFTYVFCGDGCLMEGIGQEAMSLAGHLGLDKLIVIYDDNHISIDGATELSYTEDKEAKYRALNFHTIVVANGDTDFEAIRQALTEARLVQGKPKMILLRTTIGYGAKLQGTEKVHGAPLGAEEIKRVKQLFERNPEESFVVEKDVYEHFKQAAQRGAERRAAWNAQRDAHRQAFPEAAALYDSYWSGAFPEGWRDKLPRNSTSIATRKASENVLASILPSAAHVIGGSADLTGSNLTRPGSVGLTDFQRQSYHGRYLRFGVREHAMAGVMNGIDAHGGLIVYGATFLNFIGYALGAVRLSAISEHGVIYVATHDSIGLGEDGPTHQPIELLASLRAMPNLLLFRPSDQTETSAVWSLALERRKSPSVICLTRQSTTPQDGSSFDGVARGAYIVKDCGAATPQVIFIGTGSEVGLCVEAASLLQSENVPARVVSMPCTRLFDAQSREYMASILPDGVPVLSVEVYAALGWEKYSHLHVGMTGYGASAPAPALYKHFGFTPAAVVDQARKLINYYQGRPVPSKLPITW